MALNKANRLSDKKDFDLVFKKGSAVKGNFLFIRSRDNNKNVSRFGFSIPTKVVSRAVIRNRLKRIFSKTASQYISQEFKGKDVVLVVIKKGDEKIMNSEFEKLLNKSSIFQNTNK